MLKNHGVVQFEEGVKNLDQNDFGIRWKLVHMAFNKFLQPKSHTRSPFTMQDEISMYLLIKGETVNFTWVLIDWIVKKVKKFNLPMFSSKEKQREDSKHFGCHLTKIFKHFKVKLNGFESKQVIESKKIRTDSLRLMRVYDTVERGFVFYLYLKDDDVMVNPKDEVMKPSPKDRITIQKAKDENKKAPKRRKEPKIGESSHPAEIVDVSSNEVANLRKELQEIKLILKYFKPKLEESLKP